MQKVKCLVHSDEYHIPISREEFASGKFHGNVDQLDKHSKNFPDCKFEVTN